MSLAATMPMQQPHPETCLSTHARQRMGSRGISQRAIEAVLAYGRAIYIRDAMIMVIGRKEVKRYKDEGIDLYPYEGIHVVCVPNGSKVLTTYRNRDLSGLRLRRGRGRFR